jgi:hypothetical protein
MIRTKKRSWWIALIGLVVLTGLALAQSKSDFERAARESGCGLIPYESLTSKCRYAYRLKGEWCTGDRKSGCASLSKDQKDEARKRRDNAVECLKYQEEVRDTYKEALEKLDRETQDDVKPFVDEIIKKIKEEQPGHFNDIEQTKNRRDNCNELLQ